MPLTTFDCAVGSSTYPALHIQQHICSSSRLTPPLSLSLTYTRTLSHSLLCRPPHTKKFSSRHIAPSSCSHAFKLLHTHFSRTHTLTKKHVRVRACVFRAYPSLSLSLSLSLSSFFLLSYCPAWCRWWCTLTSLYSWQSWRRLSPPQTEE